MPFLPCSAPGAGITPTKTTCTPVPERSRDPRLGHLCTPLLRSFTRQLVQSAGGPSSSGRNLQFSLSPPCAGLTSDQKRNTTLYFSSFSFFGFISMFFSNALRSTWSINS